MCRGDTLVNSAVDQIRADGLPSVGAAPSLKWTVCKVGLRRPDSRFGACGLVVPLYTIGAVPMSMIMFLLLQPFLGDEVARGLATQFRIGPDN